MSSKNRAEASARTTSAVPNRSSRCSGARIRSRTAPTARPTGPPGSSGTDPAAIDRSRASSSAAPGSTTSTTMRSGSLAFASGNRSAVRSGPILASAIVRCPIAGSAELRATRVRPPSSNRPPDSPSMAAETKPGAASADDDSATASGNRSGMCAPSSVSNIRMTRRADVLSSRTASAMLRLSRSSEPVMTTASESSTPAARSVLGTSGSPTTIRTPMDVSHSAVSSLGPIATTCSSRRRSSSIVRRPRWSRPHTMTWPWRDRGSGMAASLRSPAVPDQASLIANPRPTSRSTLAAMTRSFRVSASTASVVQATVSRPQAISRAGW